MITDVAFWENESSNYNKKKMSPVSHLKRHLKRKEYAAKVGFIPWINLSGTLPFVYLVYFGLVRFFHLMT